jgi:hypothetical protein
MFAGVEGVALDEAQDLTPIESKPAEKPVGKLRKPSPRAPF